MIPIAIGQIWRNVKHSTLRGCIGPCPERFDITIVRGPHHGAFGPYWVVTFTRPDGLVTYDIKPVVEYFETEDAIRTGELVI